MRIAVMLCFLGPALAWGGEAAPPLRRLASGRQARAPSAACGDSFVVRSYSSRVSAAEVLASCQRLRNQLQQTWLGESERASWRPCCEVVVHGSRQSYEQAVGPGAAQTSGSSFIRFNHGRVAVRRIDLIPNEEGRVTALAHELTHVVLADRFAGRQPPRWVDEGVATLSDSAEKQLLHRRDCQYALNRGTALPLAHLVQLERCATYDQFAAFYGQSVSLVGYLVQQDSPQRFLAFVELAMKQGYDGALRQTYGIEGLAQLETRWREHALASAEAPGAGRLASLRKSGE